MVVSICNSLQYIQSLQNAAKFCKLLQILSRTQQVCDSFNSFLIVQVNNTNTNNKIIIIDVNETTTIRCFT